jgi:hypothetical protein
VTGQLAGDDIPQPLSGYMWRGPDSWGLNLDAVIGVHLRNVDNACEADSSWLQEAALAWDEVEEAADLDQLADRFTELDRTYVAEEDLTLIALAAVRNAAIDDQRLDQGDGNSVGYVSWYPGWTDWHGLLLEGDDSSLGENSTWASTTGSVHLVDLVPDETVEGSAWFVMESDDHGLPGEMSLEFEVEHCDEYRPSTIAYDEAYDAAMIRL